MITLLLASLIAAPDDVVNRFQTYMKGAKDLSVTLKMSVEGNSSPGTGVFKVLPNKHLMFRMKWSHFDYSFSIVGSEAVAIERSEKVYREYPPVGELFGPEGDISPVPDLAFPIALATGTLRAMIPQDVTFKSDGPKVQDGVAVDQLSASWPIQFGSITLRARIDSVGRLVGFDRITTGPNANTVHMKFGEYKLSQGLTANAFRTPIPLGFVPETLPTPSFPLNLGERMPWKGWKSLTGGKALVDYAAKKVLFLAIGEPGCEVSRRAIAAVSELGKKVAAKGAVAAGLSLSKAASQKPVFPSLASYFDPTGHAADDLRAPGTPMFLLVAGNGRVTRIWLGFDPKKASEFSADVLAWVEKSKNPDAYFQFLDGG